MRDDKVRQLDFSNWPLPDEYALELGRMIALWASLESALDIYVAKLAGLDGPLAVRGFIILKHSPASQKIDMLEALCEQLLGEYPHLKSYKSTLAAIRSANVERNVFVHNGMFLNEDTGRVESARGTARGKLKVRVETVTPQDIRRATVKIHEAMCLLHSLVTNKNVPPRWARKASP